MVSKISMVKFSHSIRLDVRSASTHVRGDRARKSVVRDALALIKESHIALHTEHVLQRVHLFYHRTELQRQNSTSEY